MGLFFNMIVGKIAYECKIPESEVSEALSVGDKAMSDVDVVSLEQAKRSYAVSCNWRKKKVAIWQIYQCYKLKYGKVHD